MKTHLHECSAPDAPIPIVLAITELDVGGAERALVRLATSLDRNLWKPSICCLGPEAELAQPLRDHGLEVTCLDVPRRRPDRAIRQVRAELERQKPRLIQSFLFHANLLTRLAAWSIRGPRPCVLAGVRVAERQATWHLMLERWTKSLTTGSVCVSEGVRRWILNHRVARPEQVVVIPNGIDPAPFDQAEPIDRESLGLDEDASVALFLGRLDRQKGIDHLLEAAELVMRGAPEELNWQLLIVGDGPWQDRIERQIARLPEPERVHLLGRRQDVARLLKSAQVLVLPSLWEGMPNVVLEAMAAGRPVIGSQVEGTEDLIIPGETGWLVPPADPSTLAAALLDAAVNPERSRLFGERGRRRLQERFTHDRVSQAYQELWWRCLGVTNPGRGTGGDEPPGSA